MENAIFRSITLAIAMAFGLAIGACKDEELLQACQELCNRRIACAQEQGEKPPGQTTCETACLGLQGDGFVERSEECKDKAPCDYEACVDP